MRLLYRILDWCEQRKVDVFFQQMWGNVDWNTFPESLPPMSLTIFSSSFLKHDDPGLVVE
jgi:hypothetical protein